MPWAHKNAQQFVPQMMRQPVYQQQQMQPAAAPYQPAADSSVPTSPAKKWQPYGGYDPKNRAGAVKPEQVDSLSSAPAKSWQPYGGYDPKSRAAGGASAPAAPAYAPAAPAEAYEAASAAPAYAPASTDPLSSAPAKKWQPYGGYDPKNRARAAHAPASAGASYAPANTSPASEEEEVPLDAAAAKALEAERARLMQEADKAEELKATIHANAQHLEELYEARYSPEIEAERQERVAFYVGLGVPEDEANRMVARIVAAYAQPAGKQPVA